MFLFGDQQLKESAVSKILTVTDLISFVIFGSSHIFFATTTYREKIKEYTVLVTFSRKKIIFHVTFMKFECLSQLASCYSMSTNVF